MPNMLVRLLSDGRFHSGRDLGVALGVGRAAVWKQVQGLVERGIPIEAIRGKGYRVAGGFDLLDVGSISARLSAATRLGRLDIDLHDLVDSTNAAALRYSRVTDAPKGYVCIAEQQGAGRGRRGRPWVSPYARNIYTSLVWTFDGGLPAIQGLSIAVGIAVCEAVESLGCEGVSLKWPNDVCHQSGKLAGILIEVAGDVGGECTVVIGIGLNVSMPNIDGSGIDQPWVDLARIGYVGGRNEVAAALFSSLVRVLAIFEKDGMLRLISEWHRLDVLRGRHVQVHVGGNIVEGVAAGIDHSGALLLDLPSGRLTFSSGEVSVRGWK